MNPLLLQQIKLGNLDNVKTLILQGADRKNTLTEAVYAGHFEIVKYLIETSDSIHTEIHDSNDFAFRYAVFFNYYDIVKLLLDNGANINVTQIDDICPLADAIRLGYDDITKLLLDRGIDIHLQNDEALQWAVRKGNVKLIKLFVNRSAYL